MDFAPPVSKACGPTWTQTFSTEAGTALVVSHEPFLCLCPRSLFFLPGLSRRGLVTRNQSEFSNIWIKIWPKPQPVCPHQADQLSYWVSNPFSDIDFDCCLVIYKWIFIVMEKYFETKFSGAFSSCESYEKTFCHFNRAPCSEDTPSVYCSGQLLSLSFSRRRLLKPEVWQNVVCHMLATLFLVYYS